MAKIYRDKATGKKLYPVCKWEDNQHKIYNAHDRIMNRIYEAQETGGEDLEALYKEQERIEKALEIIDRHIIEADKWLREHDPYYLDKAGRYWRNCCKN